MKMIRLTMKNLSLFSGFVIVCILYKASGIGCPILFLTGIPCLGCGMTRAIIHLLQFDFKGAVAYHPMSVVLPILCILWLFFWKEKKKRVRNIVFATGIVMFVIVYFYRMFIMKDALLQIDVNNGLIYKIVYIVMQGIQYIRQ